MKIGVYSVFNLKSLFGAFKGSAPSSKSAPVYSINALTGRSDSVTRDEAMGLEAFYSCIQDQCSAIGSLPVKLYRQGILSNAPERVRSGQAFNVLCDQPNDYQTMAEFIEMIVISYRTNGAFYALPFYDAMGRLSEIIPFANQDTVNAQMDINGQIYYTYTTNDGKAKIQARPEELFIVKGMTFNGFTPIRPLTQQAQLINMSSAQEENYRTLQTDGITSQMALATENLFDNKEARMRLKEDFVAMRGAGGRKQIPIFEQGLKPISLNLTPQELDLLGQREFTVKRICAVTETMPHRINATTMQSSDRVFELDECQFKKWNPLICKIERALTKLAGRYLTVKLDRSAFYEGSPVRLAESVERQFRNCMINLAEAREILGQEYVPDTEEIWAVNTNNITLGKLTDIMAMTVEDRQNQNQTQNQPNSIDKEEDDVQSE